jgi:hypothetical protein
MYNHFSVNYTVTYDSTLFLSVASLVPIISVLLSVANLPEVPMLTKIYAFYELK